MIKTALLSILTAIVLLAAPTLAAPAKSTIAVNPSSQLVYGGLVTFDTEIKGVHGNERPYIVVVCKQGDVVVYQYSSHDLSFEFPLVDQEGQGLEWPGGTAECVSQVWARTYSNNYNVRPVSEEVRFTVEG
jgi:hypothetical protein